MGRVQPAGQPRPLVVAVYGGPCAQQVTNTWSLTVDMRAQYLAQQGFPRLPDQVAEGLCQLLAYAWVRRQDGPAAGAELRVIAEAPDPVYGGGFRRARHQTELGHEQHRV